MSRARFTNDVLLYIHWTSNSDEVSPQREQFRVQITIAWGANIVPFHVLQHKDDKRRLRAGPLTVLEASLMVNRATFSDRSGCSLTSSHGPTDTATVHRQCLFNQVDGFEVRLVGSSVKEPVIMK